MNTALFICFYTLHYLPNFSLFSYYIYTTLFIYLHCYLQSQVLLQQQSRRSPTRKLPSQGLILVMPMTKKLRWCRNHHHLSWVDPTSGVCVSPMHPQPATGSGFHVDDVEPTFLCHDSLHQGRIHCTLKGLKKGLVKGLFNLLWTPSWGIKRTQQYILHFYHTQILNLTKIGIHIYRNLLKSRKNSDNDDNNNNNYKKIYI